MNAGADWDAALRRLAGVLEEGRRPRIKADPEDQLKPPVIDLLRAAGADCKLKVGAATEVRAADLGVRPDIGVSVGGLLCGYVELKAPGKGANPRRYKGHDREQWQRLRDLPNLIYTDGCEWALYRNGALVKERLPLENASGLRELLRTFLLWEPHVPVQPRRLAKFLAPFCRFIRDDVEKALQRENSAIRQLASEWRSSLFPEASDAEFADAYAQSLAYALLLARLEREDADVRSIAAAADALAGGNNLLAEVLRVLGQDAAREDIAPGLDLLTRSLNALDTGAFIAAGAKSDQREPWLYFYEDFLAAYDPKLRKNSGVYYTPPQVVRCQVRLVSELLRGRFGKPLAFADDGVTFLDPAAGTGAYLVAAIQHALDLVRERQGPGAVAARASLLARNLYGFECLVGPYAVTHLRLAREIRGAKGELPGGRLQVFLADTLQSPWTTPPEALSLQHRPLVEEQRKAIAVKDRATPILVCLGNPPYDRQQIAPDEGARRKGGWVRHGDREEGAAVGQRPPILEDFLRPAREAKAGVHLKNLYNDYVYFWRWALWKLFDAHPDGGIVSFITASSYLAGPGFVGMREVMRRTFDELWLLDLEGGGLGARKTENVFAIRTPVAIAVGMRKGGGDRDAPAKVRYAKIEGTREEKLASLERIECFADVEWRECPDGWQAPFKPEGEGDYFSWPALTDLFPWQHSGVEFKRIWPIGKTEEMLHKRWAEFASLEAEDKRRAFKETQYRRFDGSYKDLRGEPLQPLAQLGADCPPPISPYAYRSFDRQYAFLDNRFADRLRPELLRTLGNEQIFLTSLLTDDLGEGPAAVVTELIPDRHHFSGRGAKDIIPLWRDSAATHPNITPGLLDQLAERYADSIAPAELYAYCYALLAAPGYARRYAAELETPGPRIPIAQELALFRRAAELGRHLVWLHTWGARLSPQSGLPGAPAARPAAARRAASPPAHGKARCRQAVPGGADDYPDRCGYDAAAREIRIGPGRFGPVSPQVWNYEVSGYRVVQQWIKRRLLRGAGRRSSPLDDIRPRAWDHRLTDALLQLLWTLEHTLAMSAALDAALEAVAAAPCLQAAHLPAPSAADRRPPRRAAAGDRPLLSPERASD